VRGLRAPTAPDGFLAVEPARTPGPRNANAFVLLGYALRPVTLRAPDGKLLASPVEHQLAADVGGSIGLGRHFAVGAVVPTVPLQSGDDVRGLSPGAEPLPRSALGDVAVTGKATVVEPGDLGGLGLAALARVDLPTGDPASYASDGGVRAEGRLLGELGLLAATLRVTAGARLRTAPGRLVNDGATGNRFGSELPWAVGLTLRPQVLGIDRDGRLRVTVEALGALGLEPRLAARAQSPASLALSTRYTVGEVSLLGGVELPAASAPGVPIVRPFVALGFAPRFEDADEDGIEDPADGCPELAEDRDGFEDGDGCPDFDDDSDGVGDGDDRCPRAAEDEDGFEDGDGCPDPDDDADGTLDAADACPRAAGPRGGPRPGCAELDTDADGVPLPGDRCPAAAEDRDGNEDDDGCPDPDDDADGVPDTEDACPREPGLAAETAYRRGCPDPDPDGDTFEASDDRCPAEAEDFDGAADDDGCPEPATRGPLLRVEERDGSMRLVLASPLRFAGEEVAPSSLAGVRALAAWLRARPELSIAVGVRPDDPSPEAEQAALDRALGLAITLRWLSHRDDAAEALGFRAVADQPGSASGVGVRVLGGRPASR
ncbi:MAG: thrombospondin type 3 repeat-containing protein, partial [Deltaproteobacteria bacterium]|nr:thrombospondin type 3 repeat-containing protein [Deltaproteobacteria bacterium]